MHRVTWKRTRRLAARLVAVALAISLTAFGGSCARVGQPPERFTGALPKPLNQMTNREFAQFVAQLRWSDSTDTTRRCDTLGVTGAACRGNPPAETTRARIVAEWTSYLVGRRDSPRNGAVVWKLRNLGRRTENRYSLRPGANVSYYVVVFPPAWLARRATWQMIEVDTDLLAVAGDRQVAPHKRDTYHRCDYAHRGYPYGAKRVLFAWCPGDAPRELRGKYFAPTAPTPSLQLGLIDAPGWGDCSSGCCTGGR